MPPSQIFGPLGCGILKGTRYPPQKKSHTSPTKHKQHHCDLSRLEPFFPLISASWKKLLVAKPQSILEISSHQNGKPTTGWDGRYSCSTKWRQYVLFGSIKSLYLGHLQWFESLLSEYFWAPTEMGWWPSPAETMGVPSTYMPDVISWVMKSHCYQTHGLQSWM